MTARFDEAEAALGGRAEDRDPAEALAAYEPIRPPTPKPWDKPAPTWRVALQFRRNAIPTWLPPAYELDLAVGSFFGRKSFLMNDRDAIRRVLIDNAENYGRTPATIRILHPMIGDGLFLAEGERWRRQRRVAAPAFQPRSLAIVAEVAARRTAELADRLARENRPAVDLLAAVQRLALEIAGEALFSQAMERHASELRQRLRAYGQRLARPHPLDFLVPLAVPTPQDWARRRLARPWHGLLERIIAERQATPPADPPRDLFDMLRAAKDPESGHGFDAKELRDQFATLLVAGHETTALALFWALYLLALAPDVQEAVAREAAGLELTPETAAADLDRLVVTRAVVQETLRLYPPAYTVVRLAKGPDKVAGHDVPAGSLMIVSVWVLHRHKKLWRDPELFDPRRFLPGVAPPDRFAYLPFGIGPRVCIGAQFALTEAVTVLATLLKRFRVELVGPTRVLPVAVITTVPDRAPAFRLVPRAGGAGADAAGDDGHSVALVPEAA